MMRAWFAILLAGSVPVAAASQADRSASSTAPVGDLAEGLPGAELLAKQSACIACHAAEGVAAERLAFRIAPDLIDIAERRAPGWVAQFLTADDSPHPQVLWGDAATRSREAFSLAMYLSGGVEPKPDGIEVGPGMGAAGERLYNELGCFACHEDDFSGRDLIAGWSIAQLGEALEDPTSHATLVGRMPDMHLEKDEALALAAWLLRDQAANSQSVSVPGLKYSYYEEEIFSPQGVNWDELTPVETGSSQSVTHNLGRRKEAYGIVFESTLTVPEGGEYRFWTNSDDGSELFINGDRIVENLGTHPMRRIESDPIQLAPGPHDLRITFFEQGGGEGLQAGWSGPDFDFREFESAELTYVSSVPMRVDRTFPDPNDAMRESGRALYDQRNCASCHEAGVSMPRSVPTLAQLRAELSGCLSDAPSDRAVDYGFNVEQRELLVDLLRNRAELDHERSAQDSIYVHMNQNQCMTCHARDGVGEPSSVTFTRFVGADDLGEEGRVPPSLHDIGAKLTESALEDSIANGLEYRPSVKARMPAFSNVDKDLSWQLAKWTKSVDALAQPASAPEFSADAAKVGHQLSGTQGGLACIACHGAGGQLSVGVQGPSLSDMAERLEYDWYRRWMANPPAMRPGTRMLNVFGSGRSPIVDLYGGDPEQQIDAIWQYLSLAGSMPLPAGLVTDRSSYELVPVERPVYFGTFYRDASARVMAVGFPERVSVAFDMHNVRLHEVWRGDFMNAKGTWDGRAGQLEGAGGADVLAMPDGPAVAVVGADGIWPEGGKATMQMVGHDRDRLGHPTFRYSLRASGIEVAESLQPVLAAGGAGLVRSFVLRAPKPVPHAMVRVHDGEKVVEIPVKWATGSDGSVEFVVEVEMKW
ncbi:MAG: c-type cytochrome [Planctomycetes bacterium]|nr:c-type cytochrome [Planctomycetota bacterium]